jgi:redox-sensitive bicupin YhaK (pirin superfamily)
MPSTSLSNSQPSRRVAFQTKGSRHGPVTRLMSPGDVGEMVKPFVFLDLFETESFRGGFAPHPHSGIATHTTFLRGGVKYADSTGASGELHDGAVEWMRAGRGVWHTGQPLDGKPILGYQLWLALPPELELAPAESQYLGPETIPSASPARVLLGNYGDLAGPIQLPISITYLHVRLKDGEQWTYAPPADHDIAWVAVNAGRLNTGGKLVEREMAVFEEGHAAIEFTAIGATEFVLGSSAKHPHPLVLGSYSVHTNNSALLEGERHIEALSRTPEVAVLQTK